MPFTAGTTITVANGAALRTAVNALATKYSKTALPTTYDAVLGGLIYGASITDLKNKMNECNIDAKCTAPVNLATIVGFAAGDSVTAALWTNIESLTASISAAFCSCQCNYACTCQCNYACTCQCNYSCTCDCAYSCTCNCNYSCTCVCNYSCGCDNNVGCPCDCNYQPGCDTN